MDRTEAESFARAWVDAWNDRDIAAILAHYDDDIIFHSPGIALVTGKQVAAVTGKVELRTYWTAALERAPKLYFALDQVFIGSDTVTLLYTNHRDQAVTETFVFGEGGKIVQAFAAYA